ncbi:MAG: protease pro-enzyme activation domain-containing protein [Terracidiphilus sp.]
MLPSYPAIFDNERVFTTLKGKIRRITVSGIPDASPEKGLHSMNRFRCRYFFCRVVLQDLKAASVARCLLLLFVGFLSFGVAASGPLRGQTPSRITQEIDVSQMQVLPAHHPQWAMPANEVNAVPADLKMGPLTIVLARSAVQEQAFLQLLADQQDPTSPDYHHWLTPEQAGARFGLSQADLDAVSGWLTSQGLQVNWVSPSRMLINFSGAAADMNRAFQTEFRSYKVNGEQRISVSSDPMIPRALAPVVRAVRGLYTVDERPQHQARTVQLAAPENTSLSGNHYLAPADFATIYDLPSGLTGAGVTIGIVGESRTNFADFDIFRQRTLSTFPNPTEIVPTAYGGVDPGPALTAPPGAGVSTSDQVEATLDITRAGSVAPGAQLLLVTASASSGGIGVDAEYLIYSTPVPAQIMSISFGACELNAGSAATAFWETMLQQAASEGISTFISSGDSGASGCDAHGGAPPANPLANSINYLCASGYATCVGGSEFNDAANPSQYWNSTNGPGLLTALSYIPEGGWNDPLSSGSTTEVSSSGGGVSIYVATPAWQVGAGVPAGRSGRYTPDISLSGSCHDGYFVCLAASGGSCATGSGGTYSFLDVCGTSASAPSMAGITALLDQKLGTAQGSINQALYAMAAAFPAVFHDITVASSGVTGCSVNTPSMCNNSIPSPTSLTGGQAGYLVSNGYDEVTGLGSLDVSSFFSNYVTRFAPSLTLTPSASSITITQPLTVSVSVGAIGGLATPTGSVALTSGSYNSGAIVLNSGNANINILAGALASGTDTLTVTYTPDSSSSALYASVANTTSVTVVPPGFQIVGSSVTVSKGAAGGSTITVTPSGGFTGNVTLTAVITSSPSGAQYSPTLSFGSTSPVSITGITAQTATLTISTTAATSGALVYPARLGTRWYAAGGAAFACILLFCVPTRQRRSRTIIGMFALLFAFAGGALSCGGGGSSGGGGGGGGGGTPGTTSGTYTITVTATSGSTTATSTVTLTVQ